MYDVKLAYFPIGRRTFDMETAQQYFPPRGTFCRSYSGLASAGRYSRHLRRS